MFKFNVNVNRRNLHVNGSHWLHVSHFDPWLIPLGPPDSDGIFYDAKRVSSDLSGSMGVTPGTEGSRGASLAARRKH